MPQASAEVSDYWDGDVDDMPKIKHLEDAGFRVVQGFQWLKPSPGYELTERDIMAIHFLIEEWDWGGLVEETDQPILSRITEIDDHA